MPYIPGAKIPSEGTKEFGPGTVGCHEALHLARMLMIVIDEHLADHPAVRSNPEWDALAATAVKALGDLYHAIGKVHLAAQLAARPGKGTSSPGPGENEPMPR